MKKFFIISVFIFQIAFFPFSLRVEALSSKSDDFTKSEEYLERNWKLAKISSDIQEYIFDYYDIHNQFEDEYPEYYGGIYINEDATSIVLQIVKDNIPSSDTEEFQVYKKIISMNDSIKVEYVNRSFNELNDLNNRISVGSVENINIVSNYVDVINNKVVVEFSDNNSLLKTRNDNLLENADVIFKTAESGQLRSDLNPGQLYKIYKPVGSSLTKIAECSVGFRSKYNGKVGFVTAGHCFEYGTSLTIGTASLIHFSNGGYYDYAFVEAGSGYSPTNKLSNPLKNTTTLAVVDYCPTLTVGTAIAKDGFKTGVTQGKITAINTTVTFDADGITLKGMINSNLSNDDGDSGGVVYIPRTDANGGPIPIGILSGGAKGFLGIGSWMAFTSINNLPAEIQRNRY